MVKAEKGKKKVEWCDWQVKEGVRLLLVALSGKVFNTTYYSLAELDQGDAVTWQSNLAK